MEFRSEPNGSDIYTGKWPSYLAMVRHGQSAYNFKKEQLAEDAEYQEFVKRFDEEFDALDISNLHTRKFPSEKLKQMAMAIMPKLLPETNDFNTPLTSEGDRQSEETGYKIPKVLGVPPKVIYKSPYVRTDRTLQGMWPGMREAWGSDFDKTKVIEDEKLREREHGMSAMYGDWRLYYVMHPEYALYYKHQGEYQYRPEAGETMAEVRLRAKEVLGTIIRKHGGTPELPEDLLLDLLNRKAPSLSRFLHNKLGIEPTKKEEPVLLITHHLHIMATRAELERWSDDEFVKANTDNRRPPNCSVTVYRPDEARSYVKGGRYGGSLRLDQENRVLY